MRASTCLRTLRAATAALLLLGVASGAAYAGDGVFMAGSPIAASGMQVSVDHARPLDLESPAVTVFVANPAIADVQTKDPRRILVFGRKVGGTTIYVTNAHGQVNAYSVDVVRESGQAAAALTARSSDSKIKVRPAGNGLTVEGEVETPREAAALKRRAEKYLDDKSALDYDVGLTGETQVNLQVRIVEVSRSVSRSLGFSWDALSDNGSTILGLATGRNIIGSATGTPTARSGLGVNSFLFGYRSPGGSVNINGVIDALQTEGVVSILAQPNLTAVSGQTASFLAGGEFPVPVAQQGGETFTVEWKKFGVALDFVPVVLDPGRISIRVRPEVSEITDRGAVTMGNVKVPGLAVRRAETTVELASGQSFAIAGLFQNNISSSVNEFPWLADVPIIGQLLRSNSYQHDESELVIIVTPYIVRPVSNPATLRTPADSLVFANELEQAVFGRVQVMPPGSPRLIGPAGFILEDKP